MGRIIRDEVLNHPDLDERMLACETACDLPEWWIPGKHDKDLLQGVARHGLARMDYYVLNDPELSFKDILKRYLGNEPLLDKKVCKEYEKARADFKSNQSKKSKAKDVFEFDDDEEPIKDDSKDDSKDSEAKKDDTETENNDDKETTEADQD